MIRSSRIILIVSSTLFVVLLGGLAYGFYIIKMKNEKASEIFNTAESVAEATVITKFVQTVQTTEKNDIEALDSLTLTSDKLVLLIENIENAGQLFGLDINIASVERIEDKKAVEPTFYRIEVETGGGWIGTYAFLKAVESLPTRIAVDELNFTQEEEGWKSRILLTIYSFD